MHPAADGGLARVRLPGGVLSAAQLRVLAVAAAELGNGRLELTSRANVQIRALAPGVEVELGARLSEAGLLPSVSHERVRNIVASPLSGLSGGVDVLPLAAALDEALCGRPRLAELPGRFLFALDDGRGDVARFGADVTLVAHEDRVQVETFDVPVGQAVATMLALAEAFLDERAAQGSRAWRVAELDGAARLGFGGIPSLPARSEPVGVVGGALVVLAPLGRLSVEQALVLAGLTDQVRVTPWRSVVLPGVSDPRAAASAGLGVAADSPWYRVSACTGRPGCASALADVQADAGAAALVDTRRWAGRPVHWSGCARRCGRPRGTEVDVVATGEGYRIDQ